MQHIQCINNNNNSQIEKNPSLINKQYTVTIKK